MSLISLVIPCYNVSPVKLDRMMTSVLSQTYDNVEVILIDDGSSDDTLLRLHNWHMKFIHRGYDCLVLSKQHGGVASAINIGLQHISGDFISFLDADDQLRTNYIEKLHFFLVNNSECNWVRCNAEVVNENNIEEVISLIKIHDKFRPDKVFEEFLAERIHHLVWLFMIRKSYFEKCIPSLTLHENMGSQEWQILLPLAYNSCFGVVEDILYKYVLYSDSHYRSNIKNDSLHKKYIETHAENVFETLKSLSINETQIDYYMDLASIEFALRIRDRSDCTASDAAINLESLYRKYKPKCPPPPLHMLKQKSPFAYYSLSLISHLINRTSINY